jgi:hypothetical protein
MFLVRSAVPALAVLLLLPGCVKSNEGAPPFDGSGQAGDARGGDGAAPPADGPPPAAAMPPKDCRGLRNCIHACDKDTTCATRCVSTAPAAARALHEMIRACSAQACPDQDISCRCEQECQGGGLCAEMVDLCNDGDPDDYCNPSGATCGL